MATSTLAGASSLKSVTLTVPLVGSVSQENPDSYTQHLISSFQVASPFGLIPSQVSALLADLIFGFFFLPPPTSSGPIRLGVFSLLYYFPAGTTKVFTIPSNVLFPFSIQLFYQTLRYLEHFLLGFNLLTLSLFFQACLRCTPSQWHPRLGALRGLSRTLLSVLPSSLSRLRAWPPMGGG